MRCVVLAVLLLSSSVSGQTPQPFPRAGEQPRTQRPSDPPVNTGSAAQQPTSKPNAQPATQSPPAQPTATATAATQAPADPNAPAAAVVWFPVYPSAQFLASYDAGRNQRYYLYGTTAAYADIVAYYRTQLDEKGNQVFKEPIPTHMFEVGRFREETMAFPPGVTVKDWSLGGSQGYPNPRRGVQPARFPTIIMIVPPPPVTPAAK
jgi:hypothetical protein